MQPCGSAEVRTSSKALATESILQNTHTQIFNFDVHNVTTFRFVPANISSSLNQPALTTTDVYKFRHGFFFQLSFTHVAVDSCVQVKRRLLGQTRLSAALTLVVAELANLVKADRGPSRLRVSADQTPCFNVELASCCKDAVTVLSEKNQPCRALMCVVHLTVLHPHSNMVVITGVAA